MIKNITMAFKPTAPKWSEMPSFDFNEAGSFIGNNVYSFELNSSYLAVRLLAKKSIAHGSLTMWCLIGVGLLYYLSAASYLFVETPH